MKPLPDLSPLYLRTTTPEVKDPEVTCAMCDPRPRSVRRCLLSSTDPADIRLICRCPCHEVKP